MEKAQRDYVEGTRHWLRSQKNLAAQVDAGITYNRKEVEFHQQAIEIDTAMLKHYVTQIEETEAELEKFLNENPE